MSYLVIQHEESPRYDCAPSVAPYRVSTIKHFMPLTSGSVRAAPQMRDRNDELRGNLSPMPSIVESYAPTGAVGVPGYMPAGVVLLSAAGNVMTGVQGAGTNEVQTLTTTGTVSGGTFDLSIEAGTDVVVTDIPYDVTAAALQKLIDQRIRRGNCAYQLGDIVVTGGPFPTTALVLTFQGTKAAAVITTSTGDDSNLTGTSPVLVVTKTTTGALGAVLLPDGTGVPTGAYVWTSTKQAAATPQTVQMIAAYTENGAFELGQGMALSQLSMDDGGNWSASAIGLVAKGTDDPALTPTYDGAAVQPMLTRDKVVSWQYGTDEVAEFTWSLANPVVAIANFGTRSRYPGKIRYDQGFSTLTGSVNMDNYSSDDRDSLLEAPTFAASAHWRSRSKIGSSGALYQMFLDMPSCQYNGGDGPADLEARRNFTSSYNFMAGYDDAAGYDFQFTLVAGISSILAYT